MISPEEIKKKALKWWEPFLRSQVYNEPFFPKQIEKIGRVRSVHLTHQFQATQDEIEILNKYSKNYTGTGYLIKTSDQNFRRKGSHELPHDIEFETVHDYISYTGKHKEWKLFRSHCDLIMTSLPQLKDWIGTNVLLLTSPDINWADVIKVCQYFLATPRPHLYLRQLPIPIHTKFIEENSALIQSLLDFLIPDHIRNKDQKKIAERYFLRYDEPLIRIRILDEKLAASYDILDISMTLSDFERIDWPCDRILITENKMNFLTLPMLPMGIAIWCGGGFNVSHLRTAQWMKRKAIYYWGDMDEHGFQILHQIRGYYPAIQSIMMDRQTFDMFQEFAVDGKRNQMDELDLLTDKEAEVYSILKKRETKNRLEQEKIPQAYADREIIKATFS